MVFNKSGVRPQAIRIWLGDRAGHVRYYLNAKHINRRPVHGKKRLKFHIFNRFRQTGPPIYAKQVLTNATKKNRNPHWLDCVNVLSQIKTMSLENFYLFPTLDHLISRMVYFFTKGIIFSNAPFIFLHPKYTFLQKQISLREQWGWGHS